MTEKEILVSEVVGSIKDSLLTASRFDGAIGWVKDAIRQGCFSGITFTTSGEIIALFNIGGYVESLNMEDHWLQSPEAVEKHYSDLANQRAQDKRTLLSTQKDEDLKRLQNKYKYLQKDLNKENENE